MLQTRFNYRMVSITLLEHAPEYTRVWEKASHLGDAFF